MQVQDLKISTDILNLFDFTQNEDAKAMLHRLISTSLTNKNEVIERQEILKGFLENIEIFHSYTYSRIDYREVFTFLETFDEKRYLPKWLKLKLQFSRKKNYQYRSKCVQLILLYHRLHTRYIKTINMRVFPDAYKDDIRAIDGYFNSFRLDYYEQHIRKNTFGINHMVQIMNIVAVNKKKSEAKGFHRMYMLFEAYISIASGINKHKFTFPQINDHGISLQDFYHPVVTNAVKNSFTSSSNVVLLTGPNMSGKSTLLKAIGICAYLGNIGFAIPASGGSMPLYDNISVFINLNDDLQSGYSHFMTEIMNLKNVVVDARSEKQCLAFFDELFRGTNIEDALEISKSTLKGLLNFPNSLFFISSHLHQLAEMEEVSSGEIAGFYLDCNLNDKMPAFTYQLKRGWSDIKIGRILFEKENLNELLQNSQ